MAAITIPYDFDPRWYQRGLWSYMQDGGFQGKRAVCVWHRRAGKDLNAVNLIATASMERPGLYWHLFPFYAQGKKIAWDGKTRAGRPFRAAFPKEIVQGENNTEMKLTLKTGSIYQVVGADKIDTLVGANPVGIVISEWSLMSPAIWQFLLPILAENGGWAIFIYTPRGKNHGYRTLREAQKDPRWFSQVLPNSQTGVVSAEGIQQMMADGMTEEMIAQEMECSFEAPVAGSYYGKLVNDAENNGRVTNVPWESRLPVHTAWDLGIGDYMSIWFYQMHNLEVRIIDFYENCGEGLAHYIKELNKKQYVYGKHYAPHDIEVRELGTGKSRLEVARTLGLRFEVGRKLPVDEGIEAVRGLLPRCWFDKEKTEVGREALKQYHKEWDDEKQTFRDKPEHDWSSHAADAFRELAQSMKKQSLFKNKHPEKAESEYDTFAHT